MSVTQINWDDTVENQNNHTESRQCQLKVSQAKKNGQCHVLTGKKPLLNWKNTS